MKIACLGWGSLIWDPRGLSIRREWFKDGPFAPVEFTRMSSDLRMTLVIDSSAQPVRLLWAHMIPEELAVAKEALRDRERITSSDWQSKIGSWQHGDSVPNQMPGLQKWAEGLDAVVWTALRPKFGRDDRSPTLAEVIDHLRGLTGPTMDLAKQYIVRAPRQIDTAYRREIEAALGWQCRDDFGE